MTTTIQVTYTRAFILSQRHDDSVVFDHPIKGVQYKLPRIKLVIDENAWSINKKKVEDIKLLQNKVVGLFNKLTVKNYDKISKQFIDLMKDHHDDFTELVPVLYETILKLLCYNKSYIKLFSLYGNDAFMDCVIDCCVQEWKYTIGEDEDIRAYKSLLEEPENIKRRYQKNNLMFICDLYEYDYDKITIEAMIETLVDKTNIDRLCIMFGTIHKKLKVKNKQIYGSTLKQLKEWSKDKTFSAKLRFQCMDVLDIVF